MYKIEYTEISGDTHRIYIETLEKALKLVSELDTECDKMNILGYELYQLNLKEIK